MRWRTSAPAFLAVNTIALTALDFMDRKAFLKLTMGERRAILAQQADALLKAMPNYPHEDCQHPPEFVTADILEGCCDYGVRWCRLCGGYCRYGKDRFGDITFVSEWVIPIQEGECTACGKVHGEEPCPGY
jgi:hypothetical protein